MIIIIIAVVIFVRKTRINARSRPLDRSHGVERADGRAGGRDGRAGGRSGGRTVGRFCFRPRRDSGKGQKKKKRSRETHIAKAYSEKKTPGMGVTATEVYEEHKENTGIE